MSELIIAFMIGNGVVTAMCNIEALDKKFERKGLAKDKEYSYILWRAALGGRFKCPIRPFS